MKHLRLKTRRLYLYRYAFRFSQNEELGNRHTDTFERLEFLGDAVLEMIVSELIYKKYPLKDEGFLTQLRSKIVCGKNLSQLAKKIGIDRLIDVGKYEGKRQTLLADVFEAFVGALFIDKGFEKTQNILVNRIFSPVLDFDVLVNTETDNKSRLLEWAQKQKKKVKFKLLQSVGQAHKKQFLVGVVIDGVEYAQAWHTTIKDAEQAAAQKTIEILKQNGFFNT